jgi:hypothetical protein
MLGQNAMSGASARLASASDQGGWDDWLDTDEHADSDADPEDGPLEDNP